MNNSNDLAVYIILGLLTWSVIMYVIINTAVSGVSKKISSELKEQNRFLILLLKTQGVKYREVYNAVMDSEEKFWKDLSDSDPENQQSTP